MYVCVYVCVCMYVCMCVSVCMYVWVYVCSYVCVFERTWAVLLRSWAVWKPSGRVGARFRRLRIFLGCLGGFLGTFGLALAAKPSPDTPCPSSSTTSPGRDIYYICLYKAPARFHMGRVPARFHMGRAPARFHIGRAPARFHTGKGPARVHMARLLRAAGRPALPGSGRCSTLELWRPRPLDTDPCPGPGLPPQTVLEEPRIPLGRAAVRDLTRCPRVLAGRFI